MKKVRLIQVCANSYNDFFTTYASIYSYVDYRMDSDLDCENVDLSWLQDSESDHCDGGID